jgi:hypothetical protein
MTKLLPAKQYDIFLKAFEKAVTEAQEAVRKMEAMQIEYICAKEALEAAAFPNDANLTLNKGQVTISVYAKATDDFGMYERFIVDLHKRMVERKVRDQKVPPGLDGRNEHSALAYWAYHTKNGHVGVFVYVPSGGMIGARVVRESRTTTVDICVVTPDASHEAPTVNVIHSEEIAF